jgi:hypothetical protein
VFAVAPSVLTTEIYRSGISFTCQPFSSLGLGIASSDTCSVSVWACRVQDDLGLRMLSCYRVGLLRGCRMIRDERTLLTISGNTWSSRTVGGRLYGKH